MARDYVSVRVRKELTRTKVDVVLHGDRPRDSLQEKQTDCGNSSKMILTLKRPNTWKLPSYASKYFCQKKKIGRNSGS